MHEFNQHIVVFQGQNKVVADMNTYPKYGVFPYIRWNYWHKY